MDLTPAKSRKVSCPSIGESPVNLECKVLDVREFPTHDMFLAEIIGVSVEESLMDEKGRLLPGGCRTDRLQPRQLCGIAAQGTRDLRLFCDEAEDPQTDRCTETSG